MRRSLRRFPPLLLLLAVLVPGCARPGAGAALPIPAGAWTLEGIGGSTLPAPSPTEEGVMVESGALELRPDGTWVLDLVGRVGRWGDAQARRATGSFRFEGATLVLEPTFPMVEPLRFTWAEEGARLVLRDPRGAEFLFARR
jgi:hypothetical protein